jgi:NADH-quinone oxidoreductase subunit L
MLILVLGSNLLLTFLGWEGVGVCSYLLISFWFEEPANGSAAKKAFIANRVGDWGFMVGIFLTWFTYGSITYTHFLPVSQNVATTTASAISLLFVIGAVGKSAQIPLYIWLPDAMAGPTPVSALIHAATMVTAGVYLLVRINPVLHAASPWVLTFIAWLGVLTALLAATIALAQTDIKKVLAYSTISQLGYMFLAIGSGAYWAAIFHMVMHAFFKALLFLGAGSVIHGMNGEQDMRRMGALRKLMPITAGCFIVGWLAISGVPPLSGYWSKDEILAYALHKSIWLYVIGLFTALLTAYYMSRETFLVFYGKARWEDSEGSEAEVPAAVATGAADAGTVDAVDAGTVDAGPDEGPLRVHPHESPWVMTVPLVVLAILSAIAGFINLPFTFTTHFLEDWLSPVTGRYGAVIDYSNAQFLVLLTVSAIVGFIGIGIAYAIYIRHRVPEKEVEPDLLYHGWYIDQAITDFMGGPGRAGYAAIAWFDRTIIDGAINGIGAGARVSGNLVRRVQNGYVRSYALGVTIGALVLAVYMLTRASF